MGGVPTRVAVQVGASAVRVAGAATDGEPWLLAELPAPGPGIAELLSGLVGPTVEELVLVHPASWPATRADALALEVSALAGRIGTVPAPAAAAGGGPRVVLDVGHAGTEITRLAADGTVLACRSCPVGGSALDDALRPLLPPADPAAQRVEARWLREALSLLPAAACRLPRSGGHLLRAEHARDAQAEPLAAVVGALRQVLDHDGPAPVLLIGGVVRAPQLAELIDGAGVVDAVVAARPDAVAVLGALRAAAPVRHRPGVAPAPAGHRPWLPPLPARRRRPARTALLAAAAAGLATALLAIGAVLPPLPFVRPPAAAPPAGVLVQYGYRLDVPPGWEHTGGRPERRRSLLTPLASPAGSDLIAVERTPLGYDTGTEPERARAELRAGFDAAVAGGSALSGYDGGATFGGREVVAYRQQDARTAVDWFVLLDGDAQLSVGCRHTPARASAVRAACAVVVGSVRRA